MGKALYREYRPLSFDDVKGQEHITNTLKIALKKGAISHAYLFTGPKGVGKTSIARILAHEVNGLNYDESETHLDIIEIDAASNRRIDEIRELRDKVHVAPTSAKYKVYIIDEVHMLTREAFNALLKTLEEPPEHVIFILATTEAHKVPDTIQSRTQRYTFRSIGADSAQQHLRMIADKEKLTISDEALALIAQHSEGSFRDSISMLDQIASFKLDAITEKEVSQLLGVPPNELLNNLVIEIARGDVQAVFATVETLKEQGMHPTKTAQALISLLRTQLHANKSLLQPKQTILLMKELLPLTGLHGSFEALEIVLLDALDFADTESPKRINTASVTSKQIKQEKPIVQKAAKTENRSARAVETSSEEIVEETNEPSETDVVPATQEHASSWNDVLKTLKQTHNTLYGALRMAEMKSHDKTITLIFTFDFHKKQLMQTKNISVLKSIVHDLLGPDYVVDAIVKKKSGLQEAKKTNIAQKEKNNTTENNNLVSVSNIFGGAELLES